MVASFSRRLAVVVIGAALTAAGAVAGPAGIAAAADPITTAGAPTLTSPADDAAGAHPLKDVVLQWSPVTGADRYEVQVSPNGDWTNNTVTLPKGGSTVHNVYEMPISLPHSFYYWRVRAFTGSAHPPWSSSRQCLGEWYAPFSRLKLPSSTDPTISWQPVEGASLYR